jgi:ubiquinone/menaquinone biosynthesis C-methylase UbiE
MQPAKTPDLSKLPFPKRLLFTFLRLFFKLLYHQLAWSYDGVACVVSLGAWQKWARSTLAYLDQRNTLEIGFGTGHLQVALHQKDIPAFGLDESAQMTRITLKRLDKLGLQPNLVRSDAEHLPFAGHTFGQLVMTFPSEYILNPSFLEEIHRLLTPGGLAVILPFAWITGHKPWERLIAWVYHITGQAPAWDERILAPLHRSEFEVTWEMVDFKTSQAVIVCLKKPVP